MPASTTAHKKMSAFEGLSRALVTGALVTAFTISPVLGGLQAAYADDASDTAKDETVYVKTGADGTVDGVYVVNLFDLDQGGTVTDPGTYESVQNLSTGQALSCKGGSVSLDVPAKTPTYYQGNLSSTTALPWNISVTYKLDGKKVSADELAGKSGKLTIQLTVDGQSDATDANLSGFANSCVVQAQGTFDESTFKLEDAGSATVAHQGNSTVVSALVIPGEDATVTLTGEARDFEYSGWQIVAMPFSMSLDLASQADGLTDQFQPLTDATAQLSDGSNFLASALGQIAAGAASLDAGAQDALAGATQLADGASTLTAGAKAAAAGTAQLADGAVSAAAGAAGVSGGAAQVSQGLSQLSAQNSQISAGATSLAEALTTAQGSASTLAQGAQAYASGVHTAYEGVQGSSAALANTQATYAQAMAALTSALQSGDVAAAASAAQSVDAACPGHGPGKRRSRRRVRTRGTRRRGRPALVRCRPALRWPRPDRRQRLHAHQRPGLLPRRYVNPRRRRQPGRIRRQPARRRHRSRSRRRRKRRHRRLSAHRGRHAAHVRRHLAGKRAHRPRVRHLHARKRRYRRQRWCD